MESIRSRDRAVYITKSVLALILLLGGLWAIIASVGWLAALGILLVSWGNNLGLMKISPTHTTTVTMAGVEGTGNDVETAFRDAVLRQARSRRANPFAP